MRDRLSWIDIARGIGIIAVIYSHGLNSDSFRHVFYAFHMPLFFFLSGVVFHHKKYPHFMPFVAKQIKSILTPYLYFAVLTYILGFYLLKFGNVAPDHMFQHILWVIYGNGNNNQLFFNVVLWFLPALFVTKVSFAYLTQFVTRRNILLILLGVVSLIGFGLSYFARELKLPLGIETAVTAFVFYGLGYLWNTEDKFKNFVNRYKFAIVPVAFVALIAISELTMNIYGSQVDMLQNKLHNYGIFYAGALAGISLCVSIGMILNRNRILEYIGQKSLVLFIWHLVVFSYFGYILTQFFGVNSATISSLRNDVITPIYTVLSIVCILFVDKMCIFVKDTFFSKRVSKSASKL